MSIFGGYGYGGGYGNPYQQVQINNMSAEEKRLSGSNSGALAGAGVGATIGLLSGAGIGTMANMIWSRAGGASKIFGHWSHGGILGGFLGLIAGGIAGTAAGSQQGGNQGVKNFLSAQGE